VICTIIDALETTQVLVNLASKQYYSFEGLQFWKSARGAYKYQKMDSQASSALPTESFKEGSSEKPLVQPGLTFADGPLYDDPFSISKEDSDTMRQRAPVSNQFGDNQA
jgi:hypothetical protein